MRALFSALAALACARVPAPPQPAPPPRPEEWIDASAPEGGDGSRERPLKAFAPRAGFVTHLATGLYEVASLPDDARLVGGKAVVLHLQGELALEKAALSDLAVQGGAVVVRGEVALERVTFSGQPKVAVTVAREGTLTFRGGSIDGLVPETRGVVVLGRAALSGLTFGGALRHAVTVEGGAATVSDSRSQGAAEAVHVQAGSATVSRVSVERGRGPAFFVAAGSLELDEVRVLGHEYAVLTAPKATLRVDGLRSEGAQYCGLGLVSSTATLKRVEVVRPGSHGAIEALESDTRIDGLTIRGAVDLGVVVRLGRLDARAVRIDGVQGSEGSGGDGITLRDASARLADLVIENTGGSGVVATQVSTVEVDGLTCRRCTYGALLVERRAFVRAKNVVSVGAREAAVNVPDDGVLELDGLEVQGGGPGVWAECRPGSRVVLSGKLPPAAALSGSCIQLR
ncbi:MAG: hypothetical protein IPJ65_21310 [Archangiaceae bacterium]|nr:hypothetical protein [Archangiaceae bacterium]